MKLIAGAASAATVRPDSRRGSGEGRGADFVRGHGRCNSLGSRLATLTAHVRPREHAIPILATGPVSGNE